MALAVDRHVALAWIERFAPDGRERVRDEVGVEEPLEIRVDGEPLAVTMRTPGEDEELALGFLLGEGLIAGPDDLVEIGPTADLAANVVEARTRQGLRRDPSGERRFHMSSSCGICGKAALTSVRQEAPAAARLPVDPGVLLKAPLELEREQAGYRRTGGLHATALLAADGAVLAVREDVGRHNAMDKAIGALMLERRGRAEGAVAFLSGRAGFELVQKAAMAGLTGVIAIGAPTSLAVDLAQEHSMLLIGFVRAGPAFNVYSGADLLQPG